MFKNVSNILGQITPKQRIIALVIIMITTILVLTGPKLIESLRTVPAEYVELVDVQNKKIQEMSNQIMILNGDVVAQSRLCTDKLIEREMEIAIMVGDLIRLESSSRQTQKTDSTARIEILPNETLVTGLNAIYLNLTKDK